MKIPEVTRARALTDLLQQALALVGSGTAHGGCLAAHQAIGVPPLKMFGTPNEEKVLPRCAPVPSALPAHRPDVAATRPSWARDVPTPTARLGVRPQRRHAVDAPTVSSPTCLRHANVPKSEGTPGCGITAFVVESETPASSLRSEPFHMGLRASKRRDPFTDFHVPGGELIGKEGRAQDRPLTRTPSFVGWPAVCSASKAAPRRQGLAASRTQWGVPSAT